MTMLPEFIVIGGMKCGSTSLDYYLKAHPQISMPGKELDYFSLHYEKGLEWYNSKFLKKENKIFGETSVSYAKHPNHEGVPERIHLCNPHVKLIYIVRDPIERIKSHFMHQIYADLESRSFERVLEEEGFESLYIYYSLYYYQIEKYLKFFPPEQFFILSVEDLKAIESRKEALKGVFKFLDIEQNFESSHFETVKYQTSQKGKKNSAARLMSKIFFYDIAKDYAPNFLKDFYIQCFTKKIPPVTFSPEIKRKLVDYIKPDTNKLREFTGNKFQSWQT